MNWSLWSLVILIRITRPNCMSLQSGLWLLVTPPTTTFTSRTFMITGIKLLLMLARHGRILQRLNLNVQVVDRPLMTLQDLVYPRREVNEIIRHHRFAHSSVPLRVRQYPLSAA